MIDLHLSKAQLNKLKKGGSFQMTKSQIEKGGCDKTHHCKIKLSEAQMKKLLRNLKSGKGFRFKPDEIEGSGFWDKLKKTFHTVKGHIEDAGQFIKNNVSQDDAKAILKTAVNVSTKLAGKEHLADKINNATEKGIDYGYSSKKKSLKEHAKDLSEVYSPELNEAKDYAKTKAKQEFDKRFNKEEEETQGEGFKKSKKGSAEMKERMARLRAMRLKKGGNIWSDMASGLIHTALPVVSGVAGEMLGGPVGAAAGAMAGQMGANAIGNATGYGLGNQPPKIATPYMQIIGGIPTPFPKTMKTTKGGMVKTGGSFLAI